MPPRLDNRRATGKRRLPVGNRKKPVPYTRYPLINILTYNDATVAHYVLGGTGIIIGYGGWVGPLVGRAQNICPQAQSMGFGKA